jgi:hypothetical protein
MDSFGLNIGEMLSAVPTPEEFFYLYRYIVRKVGEMYQKIFMFFLLSFVRRVRTLRVLRRRMPGALWSSAISDKGC